MSTDNSERLTEEREEGLTEDQIFNRIQAKWEQFLREKQEGN